MKIIEPQIIVNKSEIDLVKLINIERAGRTCYKSDSEYSTKSATEFIKKLIANGHDSVLEHEKITVMIIVDRGVTHEIVRHRIASYSQESTRYCNYQDSKYGTEITVIKPYFFENSEKMKIWKKNCVECEKAYMKLIEQGATPQEARSVLPNSLKTEIVVTYNFREWRHFFKLRCAGGAHPQMRQIAIPLLLFFAKQFPCLFDDINIHIRSDIIPRIVSVAFRHIVVYVPRVMVYSYYCFVIRLVDILVLYLLDFRIDAQPYCTAFYLSQSVIL